MSSIDGTQRIVMLFAGGLLACSTSNDAANPPDGGTSVMTGADAAAADSAAADAATADAAGDGAPPCGASCTTASMIKNLVVIVQENHTFDDHFGRYCTAAAGSNPTCNDGPACCEAAPATDPAGNAAVALDDAANAARDPDHSQACELAEMHDGAMDRYASGADVCSNPGNVTVADGTTMEPLWALARAGALADRWFQPIVGKSAANDMYLARAQYAFTDNPYNPKGAVGDTCGLASDHQLVQGTTIADLLDQAGVAWAFYAEGYAAMMAAQAMGMCAPKPAECTFALPAAVYPCVYDPSDNPFQFFPSSQDKPASSRDYAQLAKDVAAGSLPAVSFIKAIGYRTEHPGYGTTISAGLRFINDVVSLIEGSSYAPSTLVLVIYDEGGGYFDHVKPPTANTADGQPYGTRIPALALGHFAKRGHVSHVTLEHSSIVKFIEWNWLKQVTGQLMGRDVNVANLGSLLDPGATGVQVPD